MRSERALTFEEIREVGILTALIFTMASREEIEKILELSGKETQADLAWMRTVILLGSSLLGLLISLHDSNSPTICIHYMYSIIICTIALGILSGGIYLYSEVRTLNRLRKYYTEQVLQSEEGQPIDDLISASPPGFFYAMRFVSLCCFVVSIPVLVSYAIIMDTV